MNSYLWIKWVRYLQIVSMGDGDTRNIVTIKGVSKQDMSVVVELVPYDIQEGRLYFAMLC